MFPVYSGFGLHKIPVYSWFSWDMFTVYAGFGLHRISVYLEFGVL
jgi:hypothetical protein